MNSYVVLARKWRPSQFSDLVGQYTVVRTLMNAIRLNRIHQTYLFTGSRGVGKTSAARIFAKAIRCENKSILADAWIESCGQCSHCKEITEGRSVDVLEIDGASNNGVDAIREIRENVKFLPSSGNKKIYIIDEVHMLTTAAFNALLKTLEEPPEHILFIFATTEPHKIPDTIHSRCQHFDFKRVPLPAIQERLESIARAENLRIQPQALLLIARGAEGSMRDALSLLDQVIAFSGLEISIEAVKESLGLIGHEPILDLLKAIFERDALRAVQLTNAFYQKGMDLRILAQGTLELLHALLLSYIGMPLPPDVLPQEEELLKNLTHLRSIEEVELLFQVFHHGLETLSKSEQPKLVLDVLVIKCALAAALVEIPPPSLSLPSVPQLPTRHTTQEPPMQQAQAAPSITTPTQPVKTKSWEAFLDYANQLRPFIGCLLENVAEYQLQLDAHPPLMQIYFKAQDQGKKDQLGQKGFKEQLLKLSQDFYDPKIKIEVELKNSTLETFAEKQSRVQNETHARRLDSVQNNEIIKEAKSLFGADLSRIQFTSPSEKRGAHVSR